MGLELLPGVLALAATYALHSTAILGLTWLVLRRAPLEPLVRARAWKLALVGGLLTTAVQHLGGLRPLGGVLELRAPAAPTATTAAHTPSAAPAAAPTTPPTDADGALAERIVLRPIAAVVAPAPGPAPEDTAPTSEGPWRRALTWTWLAGAAYGLALVALRRGRFRARVRDRLPAWDPRAERLLRELTARAQVHRPVRLTRSRTLRVPATWGWRRPEICLPDRALAELADDELEAVLAHELGHVARGDALWLVLGQCLDALCFFQPLNRVARRGLARESEHLADAFAVGLTGRPVSLARALARVATWLDPRAARSEPAVATMAASRSALLERVERVLARAPRRGRTLAPSLAFASLPLLAVALVPGVAAGAAERGAPSASRPADSAARLVARVATEPEPPTAGGVPIEREVSFRLGVPIQQGVPLEHGSRVALGQPTALVGAPDAAAPPTDGTGAREAALALLRAQLAVLESEVADLGLHPRAAAHASAVASLRERIARLTALAERAGALLDAAAAPQSPSISGEASAGGIRSAVPPHPTPSEERSR